jgi:hypothetical protein
MAEIPANKGLLQFRGSGTGARKPNKTGQKTGLDGEKSRKKSRSASAVPDLIERDDGRFQIGLHDDAPSFETRAFAQSVATSGHRERRHHARTP